MIKLEKPIRMTVEEAEEAFYPNYYLMINCEMPRGSIIAGEVVAYAPMKESRPLHEYCSQLEDSGEYGWVMIMYTKDPLDGGPLLIEYY